MSDPESPAETEAATLAAALIERIGPLAQAAARAKDGIGVDRERLAGSGEADALIDTVVERVDELEADCRRLMRILVGFEAAAVAEPAPGTEPVPAPADQPAAGEPAPGADPAPAPADETVATAAAEPTPAEEATGVVSFPGAGAQLPSDPPLGEPVVTDAPAIGSPPPAAVAEPESRVEPAAMPPPDGAPLVPAQDAGARATEPATAGGAAADPDEPVHVSEGVRLLATQMSVAGASGADIARRLRDDFGLEDADRLIAHLFGPAAEPPR